MSLHQDLLAQARYLANRERKKPRQASLRRAISTAYYALFHLLIDEATNRLVTGPNRTALRCALARAFVHGDMKAAAQGFANSNPSAKVRPALGTLTLPTELVSVAAAFVELQQARHEADYDTARRFTRQEAFDLVEQAEKAFADWQVVRQSVPADTFLDRLAGSETDAVVADGASRCTRTAARTLPPKESLAPLH